MPEAQPASLLRKLGGRPGVRRDGAVMNPDFYTETVWARFNQQGMPCKMGGYRAFVDGTLTPARGMGSQSLNGNTYIHIGTSTQLIQTGVTNSTGSELSNVDRTPVGLPANVNYIWKVESMYDGGGGGLSVVVHATGSWLDLDLTTGSTTIYIGALNGGGVLTAIALPPANPVTGGIVVLFPYLVAFGSNGEVAWSVPNTPGNFTGAGSGAATVTDGKIIEGKILRSGPSNSPSGLLWSLDSLIRLSFVGGAAVWSFDTISKEISVLSRRSIIEQGGVYYWVGNDRFYMFNGVVRPLPNPLNSEFFFSNITNVNKTKVFAFANQRWNEIWWCFCASGATECNWAVVYNTQLGTWYDTPLPEPRSDGIYTSIYGHPVLAGAQLEDFGGGLMRYPLWSHERGLNRQFLLAQSAIDSSFTTPHIALPFPPDNVQPADRNMTMEILEPDFRQVGDMTVQLIGQGTPRSVPINGATKTFGATLGTDIMVNFKQSYRIQRVKFRSNALGGDYTMGECMAHFYPTGQRIGP